MQKIRKIISRFIFPIVLLVSIPAVRYLFVPGFLGVSDDLHIAWLYEMDRAVKIFQFPPRFVPDLSFGFGYPLFNFVYPLPFYIGEIFHLIGFSLVDSVKMVFGLSIPLSMYFMYKLLKEYMNEELSLAGAILYVYAPYRATELFVRGTIGEIVAFVFLPLITWSIVRLAKDGSLKWVGFLALSIAGLVLSHNIAAYMFMPFAILLMALIFFSVSKNRKELFLKYLSGVFLGIVSSMYFWLPAIKESSLMKYATVFNFYDHFPTIKQLTTPFFGYGASVPGPYDTMSFYLGLTGIAAGFVGSLIFAVSCRKFDRDKKAFFAWAILILLVAAFMMNHRSAFLWRVLPLLPYFQFPWRFLMMTTFAIPLLLLGLSKTRFTGVLALIIIVSAMGINFSYFKYSEYLGRGDGYYLNRYIPVPEASEEYKKTQEEYLRLPLATEVRPSENFPAVYTDKPVESLEVTQVNALKVRVEVKHDKDFILNYSKYYFPGWFAKIDGRQVEIKAGKPYGQISLKVPPGVYSVEIYYKESAERLVYDILSLIGIGASAYLIISRRKYK